MSLQARVVSVEAPLLLPLLLLTHAAAAAGGGWSVSNLEPFGATEGALKDQFLQDLLSFSCTVRTAESG